MHPLSAHTCTRVSLGMHPLSAHCGHHVPASQAPASNQCVAVRCGAVCTLACQQRPVHTSCMGCLLPTATHLHSPAHPLPLASSLLPLPASSTHTHTQVIALAAAPFLLDHPKVGEIFAPDAIKRARELVKSFNGGVGAYQVRCCSCCRCCGCAAAVLLLG